MDVEQFKQRLEALIAEVEEAVPWPQLVEVLRDRAEVLLDKADAVEDAHQEDKLVPVTPPAGGTV